MAHPIGTIVFGHSDDPQEAYESLKSNHEDWADHENGFEVKVIKGRAIHSHDEEKIANLTEGFLSAPNEGLDEPALVIQLRTGDVPDYIPGTVKSTLILVNGDWYLRLDNSPRLTAEGVKRVAKATGVDASNINPNDMSITFMGEPDVSTEITNDDSAKEETRFFLVSKNDPHLPRWYAGKDTREELNEHLEMTSSCGAPNYSPRENYEIISMTRYHGAHATRTVNSSEVEVTFVPRDIRERLKRRLAHERSEGAWLFVRSIPEFDGEENTSK